MVREIMPGAMTTYADLLKFCGDDMRKVDLMLTRKYLGYPIHNAPSEWNWNDILWNWHVIAKTNAHLLAVQLRHTHGVDLEAELF